MNSCISSGTTVQEDVDVRGVRRVQLELGVHNADMDLQSPTTQGHVVSGMRRVWGTLRSATYSAIRNTIAKVAAP